MDMIQKLTEELEVKKWQVEAAVRLIDEGNTIPFIARYRNLEEKKEQVLASIEEQGKLTEELRVQIINAQTLVAVEDLYRPYRPKRRTRATIAKEKGLEPLAALLMLQKIQKPLEEEAQKYISAEKEVHTVEEAIAGAKDILAEAVLTRQITGVLFGILR